MVEDFLKLGYRLATLMRGQEGLPADENGVQIDAVKMAGRGGEIEGAGSLELAYRFGPPLPENSFTLTTREMGSTLLT